MENKIRMMDKVMMSLMLASIAFFSFVEYGLLLSSIIMLVLVASAYKILKHNASVDERGVYLWHMASYGAFLATGCFLIVFGAIEYMKTGVKNSLVDYTLAVMALFQMVIFWILRGRE